MRPPGAQEQRHSGIVVGDIGPVEGQVEKAHTSESRPDEVGYGIVRCNPAQEGHGVQHRESILGQELPEGDAQKHPPEDAYLLTCGRRGVLVLLALCLEESSLAKCLEPRIRRLVEQDLAGDGSERIPSGIDRPHKENGCSGVDAPVEIEVAHGDRRSRKITSGT